MSLSKPSIMALLGLAATLVACGLQAAEVPTQTPIYIVVTSENPRATPTSILEGGVPEPTPVLFPTPYMCRALVVEQPFENGRMFWVGGTFAERCQEDHAFTPGSGEIWVAIFDQDRRGGEWLIFVDDWDEQVEPPFDLTLTPPEGLLQPVRGFGKVWREKLTQAQRQAIGWAEYPEIGFVTDYRYDAGGFINSDGQYVPRPGQHTLISFTGERFFFDEQSRSFDYIPAD